MDIDVFPRHELPTVMRTLRTALRTEGTLDEAEQRFLDTYARIAATPRPVGEPAPIDAAEVSIDHPHARKRLVQLSALAVMLARPMRADSFDFLAALARHLGTHDPVIDVIRAVTQGKPLKARMLSMRRGMRVMFKEAWLAEGAMGVLRFVGALAFGVADDRKKLAKYKRLGLLPEGTLGREYWKHMTEVGFNFPGEPAGITDTVAYHDIAHVLAGNDTTPLGEIQQGSFQAGNRREDGYFFVQFVVLQFHHGIRITPATGPQTGLFQPDKLLWAIHRGAQCNVDVTHQWDFWPLMPLPLPEARRRVNLLPKLDDLPAAPVAATFNEEVTA